GAQMRREVLFEETPICGRPWRPARARAARDPARSRDGGGEMPRPQPDRMNAWLLQASLRLADRDVVAPPFVWSDFDHEEVPKWPVLWQKSIGLKRINYLPTMISF